MDCDFSRCDAIAVIINITTTIIVVVIIALFTTTTFTVIMIIMIIIITKIIYHTRRFPGELERERHRLATESDLRIADARANSRYVSHP